MVLRKLMVRRYWEAVEIDIDQVLGMDGKCVSLCVFPLYARQI